ncbi:unnamed protein product [Caenorhabditis auriculariae]|uniref:DUF19 domain-containing protein n=1 Tax=Caenorhabditis auriculariae TaxID=2777116 RepID=A0A8S1GPN2_9PELO|nr:unnamed protein product [Caenorhabditis auriculariae]
MLFALLFVGITASFAQNACPTVTGSSCSPDLLSCCGMKLKNDLGLSNCPGQLAYEPDCHRQEIEDMYANGTAGLFKVCNAFNNFYTCLGSARQDCTNVGYHMKLGMSLGDSVNAASMYRQFGFACGAGLDAFANNDACMSARNLVYNYREHCSHFSQYIGCYQLTFKNQNCGDEASWWGCEYARQGSRVIMHDCSSQCFVAPN